MSEFIMTSILWAISTLGSSHYDSVQVLDEFPTDEHCVATAKVLATEVQKDMNEKKITDVDVMLACIPILEIKDPQNLNGSGLIPAPKGKSRTEWIG